MRHISMEYGSSSYMKVIGSRSRSREHKRRKSLFPLRITSIDSNSASVTLAAVKFTQHGVSGVCHVTGRDTRNQIRAFAGGRP